MGVKGPEPSLYEVVDGIHEGLPGAWKGQYTMIYVGMDWGDEEHGMYVVEKDAPDPLMQGRIAHRPKALAELIRRLLELVKDPSEVCVALETPHGLVVEALVEAGFRVYPVNPKRVEGYRRRYRASRAKDDEFDAKVLAELLQVDRDRLEEITVPKEPARELKLVARDYADLVQDQTRLVNKLQSALKDYYPEVLKWFGKIQQPSTLAFLETFPTLDAVQKARVSEIEALLRNQHYPGATDHARRIKQSLARESWSRDPAVVRSQSQRVLHLTRRLSVILETTKEHKRIMESLLDVLVHGPIFESLPGASRDNLAPRLLGEFGDDPRMEPDVLPVQCRAGTAPVTLQSGNHRRVVKRQACSKPFRSVMQQFAFCSLKESQWSREYYDSLRDRGKTHPQALRALANKWIRIIHAMWQSNTPYDEEYHRENQKKHRQKVA